MNPQADESSTGHPRPTNLREGYRSSPNAWDALERDCRVQKALKINFVRVLAQEKCLSHNEAPDRGRLTCIVVALIDWELK